MQAITHGSDLRLAPTIRGFADDSGGSAKRAFRAIARAGFSVVQLDAAMPGIRPRELDASARRDLKSTIKRAGLGLAGIDLIIPPDHFSEPAHLDRAATAAIAACQLAADLGRVPLTLNLPTERADADLVASLISSADHIGTPLVICDTCEPGDLVAWLKQYGGGTATAGIDPAGLLMKRFDPVQAVQQLSGHLGVARLSDATRGQAASQTPAGQGDLDLLAYRVSVDLGQPFHGPVVLDLRSLSSPMAAASRAKSLWDKAIP